MSIRNARPSFGLVPFFSTFLLLLATGCVQNPRQETQPPAGTAGIAAADLGTTTATVERELRGLFVTTAFNIDWPSQPGLDEYMAEDEINAIISRAQELHCNAIFLQIRAFGDRIYSKIDPKFTEVKWAVAINSGQNDPGYDPLAKWLHKCHEAGLEVHAWINPLRIDVPIRNFPCYNGGDGFVYLDASSTAVQDYLACLVNDLLNKYTPIQVVEDCDFLTAMQQPATPRQATATRAAATPPEKTVAGAMTKTRPRKPTVRMAAPTTAVNGDDDDGLDGIVIDHYLPPDDALQLKAAQDAPTQQKLAGGAMTGTSGGVSSNLTATTQPQLSKRRDWALRIATTQMSPAYPANQVANPADALVERLYNNVKAHGLRFGVSPKVQQMSQAGKWMQNKWMDYLAPEIYVRNKQTFDTQLQQWKDLNHKTEPVQIVPVLYTARVQKRDKKNNHPRWDVKDIEDQVQELQNQDLGHIHYTYHATRSPQQGGPGHDRNIGNKLKDGLYKGAAAPNWPHSVLNHNPNISGVQADGTIQMTISGMQPRKWLFQFRDKTTGSYGDLNELPRQAQGKIPRELIPRDQAGALTVDEISAWAIDKHGNESNKGMKSLP